ncbi:hypothetical protein ACWD6L_01080 [Micromonospora profundi]|uniref:DUF2178 domain-containing protein n=1 Tax=Micromonospora profundi TaxID=1420889 RepID=A0AAJ6L5B6_9ACTN|nr:MULTISPECIES: hypothetical protein [Micromonospora]KOX14805.1 hypothetical protein ADK66_01545 [Micromonospora sp. NRRL B-16802]WLS46906.1 hypothetical protein Q3V37_06520 [Micromonospora profundi]
MSSSDRTIRKTGSWSRWGIPGFAVLCGLTYFVAGWIGGDRRFGLQGFGIMLALAVALLVLSRKSETVTGLLERRDERINQIDKDATVFSGVTLTCAVLIGFVVEIARGQDGMPYAALGAIAGLAYVLALVVQRIRR